MPIWRFWLLSILTLGIYLIFWVAGVARELRRNQDPSIRVWLHVVGMLIGIASPIVAAALTEHIDRNARSRGLELGPPKSTIVVLAAAVFIIGVTASKYPDFSPITEADSLLTLAITAAIYCILVPLPWALIQLRLNRLKAAMSYPERPSQRFRFSLPEFACVVLAFVFWPLLGIGSLPEATLEEVFADTPKGERVSANVPLSGLSGGYSIMVRSDRWMRVDPDSATEDADLELITTPPDSWLVVYTLRGDWMMDDIVDFRRNEIREAVQSLDSRERRTLLQDSAVPVSHARYHGKVGAGDVTPTTWWVSTVVTEAGAVEVVGSTAGGHFAARELEAVVKSLRVERRIGQP